MFSLSSRCICRRLQALRGSPLSNGGKEVARRQNPKSEIRNKFQRTKEQVLRTVTAIGEQIWPCIWGRKRCQLKLRKPGPLGGEWITPTTATAAVRRFDP